MDEERPELRVASSQSSEEVAKRAAIASLEWPFRELAANMLRVIRGAGKPHRLPQQIIDLAHEILEASEHSNAWGIWSEMEQWLWEGVPDDREYLDWWDHRPSVVRGSLQIAASRLVSQRAQVCQGESEIDDGLRERDKHLSERLRARVREEVLYEVRTKARLKKQPKAKAQKVKTPKATPAPAPQRAEQSEMEKLPGESTAAFMRRTSQA